MLTISRTEGQSVMIGPDIVVTVVEVRGGKVRIGIEAPGVEVYREEVVEAILRDGKRKRQSCQDE